MEKSERGNSWWKYAAIKKAEMYLPNKWPTYYKKAYKCFIWDLDGNKFTDMSLMSVGTNILGYANKKLMTQQLSR